MGAAASALPLACIVAAAAAAGLTRVWIAASRWLGFLDPPNPLIPQHRREVATMGGVALAGATLAGWAVLATTGGSRASVDGAAAMRLLPAGLGFLALGAVDDRWRLSAGPKLAAQIALAGLAVACGLVYPAVGHAAVDAGVTVVLLVTMVNAVNLTDVCDGLVAGLSALALAGAAALWPAVAGWAAPAAAGALGFLLYNAPPARVFLGDAGSHWFGFLLVAIPVLAAPHGSSATHAMHMLILPAVCLFELVLLIVARASRGVPVWRGSPDHFSLRLQAAGFSRWATVLMAWSAGALCVLAALALESSAPAGRIATLVLLGVAATLAFRLVLALPAPAPAPR